MNQPNWPILTRYDQAHLYQIALPLGGIGTGSISLGGRGNLRDFEVYSHPDKGFIPQNTFFVLRAEAEGEPAVTRLLEGVIEPWLYAGQNGAQVPNHGLPRFRECSFAAAYPLGQVFLSDTDVPLEITLQAFNPLIPAEPELSGIPMAVFRFILRNPSRKTVRASLCGNLQNFIGCDSQVQLARNNTNQFRQGDGFSGLMMLPGEVDAKAEQFGTMTLAMLESENVTYRTAWSTTGWNTSLLDFWDDFSQDGRLEERSVLQSDVLTGALSPDKPIGSLAVEVEVPPGMERAVTYLISWHFPNRYSWSSLDHEECGCKEESDEPNRIGNEYANRFTDAWNVIENVLPVLNELEEKTVQFVQAFCESDLPHAVKEAALFNLCCLRTQTAFRTADGRFYGWEGCNDQAGCCFGSCTHVWNYEQATAFLFGSLAKSMREVEFEHATNPSGLMSFRVFLPLRHASEWGRAAADGQMGCIMKLYRDWQLSGDDAFLRRLWPNARRALEFCWIPGGWDADQDGVMEGCQHNTMDVEYYGPNPEIETWYLGALRAAEEMARYLGEDDFAETCRRLFEQGSDWTDAHLFNGEYYEQEIRPPKSEADIAEGLRLGMGAVDLQDPAYQLGAGCLADQLVGQYMAHICGLGYLLKPANVRKTLRSLMKYNFRHDFYGHFNHMRSYVLDGESALLVSTYPKGKRPQRPFPYATEAWTGLEYTAAAGMLYEGQMREGIKVITAVRERYDGLRRNPFDEPECGHHYARSMASWAGILAMTGFQYSGVQRRMGFRPQEGRFFWSNGYAWGTCQMRKSGTGYSVKLNLLGGELRLKAFELDGVSKAVFDPELYLRPGERHEFRIDIMS